MGIAWSGMTMARQTIYFTIYYVIQLTVYTISPFSIHIHMKKTKARGQIKGEMFFYIIYLCCRVK